MTRKEEQLRKAMLHYLEGSIHPEELEVLNRVVVTDPEARRDLAELMMQDVLLTKVGQESEFFELDVPSAVPPSAVSCRTSRIMKITRRAPIVDAPPAKPTVHRAAMAAAAILFTISVAMAVKAIQPAASPVDSMTTVMPVVAPAPVAAPLPAEPAVELPPKAVVVGPEEPKPSPVKVKPAPKPKTTSTARKDVVETKPPTTVPDGFLTLPSSSKIPPPSPSKPAPKLPPKPPPQK
jgi:hypothetical protein